MLAARPQQLQSAPGPGPNPARAPVVPPSAALHRVVLLLLHALARNQRRCLAALDVSFYISIFNRSTATVRVRGSLLCVFQAATIAVSFLSSRSVCHLHARRCQGGRVSRVKAQAGQRDKRARSQERAVSIF